MFVIVSAVASVARYSANIILYDEFDGCSLAEIGEFVDVAARVALRCYGWRELVNAGEDNPKKQRGKKAPGTPSWSCRYAQTAPSANKSTSDDDTAGACCDCTVRFPLHGAACRDTARGALKDRNRCQRQGQR